MGKSFFLVTDVDSILDFKIDKHGFIIYFEGKEIDLSRISSYWYRRGFLEIRSHKGNLAAYAEDVVSLRNNEASSLIELIHNYLVRIPHLSSIYNSELNRIDVFLQAASVGLDIPDYGLFSRKSDLKHFKSIHTRIVVKPIKNGISVVKHNNLYTNYTELFADSDIKQLDDTFFPSFFLSYIEKKYEVRTFYFNGKFYSLATFSQSDESTRIDFRKYNTKRPNRIANYILPASIEKKITLLMQKFNLKTGSIDIIVTPDDQFLFLEINPIGQFLNLEDMCNYNLTKMIAEYLSNPNGN